MTYVSDFYDEVLSERMATREPCTYVLIATGPSAEGKVAYVRNEETGVLLSITPSSMSYVGNFVGHPNPTDPLVEIRR